MASGFPKIVIGAPATDPKFQHPGGGPSRIQEAAWAGNAAGARNAGHAGMMSARGEVLRIRANVRESHCSVRVLCFVAAFALLVSSLLGAVNVFNAVFRPSQYLYALYNVIFAVVIVVMDGKPEWFARCCDAQQNLFQAVPVLASPCGRAIFYFYVGSINLVMLPQSWFWKVVYFVIGGVLCLVGLFTLLQQCCHRGAEEPSSDESEEM